jgi:hypothetical protein
VKLDILQRLREKRMKRPKGKKADGRDTKNTDAVTRRRNGNRKNQKWLGIQEPFTVIFYAEILAL